MHISDEVRAVLIQRGFSTSDATTYKRHIATGGAIGRTLQTVQIDLSGRWLERVDGWGTIQTEVDLRDYTGRAAAAVDTVLA